MTDSPAPRHIAELLHVDTSAVTGLTTLAQLGISVGYVREIETVAAEFTCPIHDVDVHEHRLDTISGWHAVLACPAYDGRCSWNPAGHPQPVEPPTDRADDDAPATSAPTRNQPGF